MNRALITATGLTAVMLVVPTGRSDASDPLISDPSGDARPALAGDALDIVAADFEVTHVGTDIDEVTLVIDLASTPVLDDTTSYWANWTAGTAAGHRCTVELYHGWRGQPEATLGTLVGPTPLRVSMWCWEAPETGSLPPVDAPATATVDGTTLRLTFAVDDLGDQGDLIHRPGTTYESTVVGTSEHGVRVDAAPCEHVLLNFEPVCTPAADHTLPAA